MAFKIELGTFATDGITGFSGTVTARAEYITGCRQYCVQPRMNQAGGSKYEVPEALWFDEDRLGESAGGEKFIGFNGDAPDAPPGGPQQNPAPIK